MRWLQAHLRLQQKAKSGLSLVRDPVHWVPLTVQSRSLLTAKLRSALILGPAQIKMDGTISVSIGTVIVMSPKSRIYGMPLKGIRHRMDRGPI